MIWRACAGSLSDHDAITWTPNPAFPQHAPTAAGGAGAEEKGGKHGAAAKKKGRAGRSTVRPHGAVNDTASRGCATCLAATPPRCQPARTTSRSARPTASSRSAARSAPRMTSTSSTTPSSPGVALPLPACSCAGGCHLRRLTCVVLSSCSCCLVRLSVFGVA